MVYKYTANRNHARLHYKGSAVRTRAKGFIVRSKEPDNLANLRTMQRSPKRVFPLSRYSYSEHFRRYYPFGNTPAEDLLQSVAVSECRRPTILSLGCGDMRSCMYTIWKNFRVEGENSNGFSGVNFVLNDRSASVLARNILFLHLCMRMPDDEVSRKEWIASMWSLWYNHELQPQHATMLSDALAQLMQWSHTWQEWSECPLGRVVRFSSPATFASVKMIWSRWNSPIEQSVDEIKLARNSFQSHWLKLHDEKLHGESKTREEGLKAIGLRDYNLFLLKSIRFLHSSEKINTMEKEYLHYLMEGTVWGESILGIPSSTLKTVVNPTLFERPDGMYTLDYNLTPYLNFIHSFQYTHAEICRTLGKGSALLQFLPVADHHFKRAPLLANSVQQFAMWLIAAAHMIRKSSRTDNNVSFIFDLDDAINLCHVLHHQPEKFSEPLVRVVQFDAIYTSNLFDHLSPPALVLNALPLLKSSGTLFTVTFKIKTIAPTSREYLETMFGFSPELFPALLGIHCLGHDGKYSSFVNNQPWPDYVFTYRMTFIWRNIRSHSLAIDTIEESPSAIMSLLKICSTSSLHSKMLVGSVESFLIILHQFLKLFQSSFASSHTFLRTLSSAIRTEAQLKPHLLQLQTQSLLHGVHMHITLTEDNCPLCRGQPLETYLQQFTVSLDITTKAHVHDSPLFSIYLVSSSGDCAVITSIACRSCGPNITLDFFLPKQCLSQYTLFSVHMNFKPVIEGSVNEFIRSANEYTFFTHNMSTTEYYRYVCPLGNIVKHIGDESTFETVVSMNKACQMALQTSKLDVKCNESNQLTLICGALSGTIVYPYAINESKTHIKISKKRNIISVTVEREGSVFYKEKPTFYIDSSNKLALPRFQCQADVMEKYCNFQMPLVSPDDALFDAKCSFSELFKRALVGEKYFALAFPSMGKPDVHALVYVHDVRFSTAFSSPVLDASYCFLDTNPMCIELISEFAAMHDSLWPSWSVMVKDAEYTFLKEVFKYFSTVTCCALSTDRHTVTLPVEKHKLWKYFDHAILFPFYPNPANPKFENMQQLTQSMQYPSPVVPSSKGQDHGGSSETKSGAALNSVSTVCKRCKKPATIHCSCGSVSYCSQPCQTLELPEHSKKCSPPVNLSSPTVSDPSCKDLPHSKDSREPTATPNLKCSNCNKVKSQLKRCKCRTVSYCSKECQRLHWPQHKHFCSAVTK